ncbi:MAG: hypothetical protein HQK89_06805 [Nitrospirae bacterium]|nr:hypothetical protein [Nitrospirota bacterium]
MAKCKKTSDNADQCRLPFYDEVQKAVKDLRQIDELPAGCLDINTELRAAIREDIRRCATSQEDVMAKMITSSGDSSITMNKLYKWTSQAAGDDEEGGKKLDFPAKHIPALIRATGGRRTMEVLAKHAGLFVLPGTEAAHAQVSKIDDQIKELHEERKKWRILAKESELNGSLNGV